MQRLPTPVLAALLAGLAPALAREAPAPAPAMPTPQGAARKDRPAASTARPQPAGAPVPSPADLQPIQHARNAGVGACLAAVGEASLATVDAPHKAHSTWVTAAPDAHVFQSIVGLGYRSKAAPHAASVISATPTPGRGCDTTTVQIYPTARPCPQLRAALLKDGSLTDELSGMPLVRSASGFQHLLLPGPANSCVIVAVGLGVSAPPAPAPQATPPQPAAGIPAPAPRSR